MADKVLDYFGGIASEESTRGPEVPKLGVALPDITPADATKLLKRAKKTDSSVRGDPMPHLVREFPEAFAEPVADILNAISRASEWPEKWKTEYLTIIPKNPNPASLAECRNISCTSSFSKLLENRLLLKLREELVPDPGQYGGLPKCGVEHLLIDLWEDILSSMEGGQTAVVLLGIDYEKAFNRMDHGVYLEQIKKLGASPESLSLVKSLLQERKMTVKIGDYAPDAVAISKGSPQGSVLGCLLYCITTQSLLDGMTEGRVGDHISRQRPTLHPEPREANPRPAAIPRSFSRRSSARHLAALCMGGFLLRVVYHFVCIPLYSCPFLK